MKRMTFFLLSFVFIAFSSCEDEALKTEINNDLQLKGGKKVLNFRAHLSGDNEVPMVETEAEGQAIFKLSKDGSSLSYKILVDNIDNITMAHIHLAPAGANGGVVAWLYPSGPPPAAPSGMVEGILAEGVLTSASLGELSLMDLIEHFYNGNAYVNVHTTDFPGGEIRGQIGGTMPGGMPE